MNNEEMIYQPFRICRGIVCLLQILGILLIIVLSLAIRQDSIDGIVVIGTLLSLCVVLIKVLYDLIKVKVIFDKEYIRLLNAGKEKQYNIPWKEIPYGYYCRDWHGNLYLVLSPGAIEQKKVKKMVNKHTNSLKPNIYIDECILIVIGSKKQMEQIEKVVHNKIVILKRV